MRRRHRWRCMRFARSGKQALRDCIITCFSSSTGVSAGATARVWKWNIPFPMSALLALLFLKLSFTCENVISIGLYFGSYGTFMIHLNPASRIAFFALSVLWADKLSINRAILSFGYLARRATMYSMNLCWFTDFLNILKCSTPFSLEIPHRSASVGSYNLLTLTCIFSPFLAHSDSKHVLRVKHVSSR